MQHVYAVPQVLLPPCWHSPNLTTFCAPSAGSGVFPTEAACCTAKGPGPLIAAPGAFEQGCGNVTKAAEPCWVVDTYFPTRQCRKSRTLCGAGEIPFLSRLEKDACGCRIGDTVQCVCQVGLRYKAAPLTFFCRPTLLLSFAAQTHWPCRYQLWLGMCALCFPGKVCIIGVTPRCVLLRAAAGVQTLA
jgi:hypothetical protein